MGGNGGLNVQEVIREIVEKDGPALARKWGEELREDRAKMRDAAEQVEVAAEIITKKCTKCGEVKALDAYDTYKLGRHGKRARCKTCMRKYRQENREQILEKDRKYRQENRKQLAEKSRKYRQENPEVGRRTRRKRRALKRNLPHQPLTPQQYEILHRQKYEIFGGNASGN